MLAIPYPLLQTGFQRQKVILLGRGDHDLLPAIPHVHSRQATLHPALLAPPTGPVPTCRFTPPSRRACGPPTNLGLHGSRVNAHMPLRIAHNLNPLHQPPTGRRKPAQGTSSMCLNGIYPRLRESQHRLGYCATYPVRSTLYRKT